MKNWFDNERFWRETENILFDLERQARAEEEIADLLSLVCIKPGESILDLPCGIGRHSLELARRGFRVTAVDRTGFYLKRAQERSKRKDVQAEWIKSDMRKYRAKNRFGLILNLFTSFGYFINPDDDRTTAMNFYESLKPGGTLVMELAGKEIIARTFQKRSWSRVGNTLVLEEREINGDWSWIDCTWTIIKNQKTSAHSFGHRLYSAAELKNLLTDCGFKKVESFGSLTGIPYDENAKRLVILAKKSL